MKKDTPEEVMEKEAIIDKEIEKDKLNLELGEFLE